MAGCPCPYLGYRTTSTDALCVLTGIPPIKISIKNNTLLHLVTKENETILIDNEELDESSFMTKLKTYNFPDYNKLTNLNIIEENTKFKHCAITIFTDGSRMEDGTSAAFVVYKENIEIFTHQIKLNEKNSIYQAELIAIQQALNWIRNYNHNHFLIYTDSESSVKALQRLFPQNEITKQIYEKILEMPDKTIHIKWLVGWLVFYGTRSIKDILRQTR